MTNGTAMHRTDAPDRPPIQSPRTAVKLGSPMAVPLVVFGIALPEKNTQKAKSSVRRYDWTLPGTHLSPTFETKVRSWSPLGLVDVIPRGFSRRDTSPPRLRDSIRGHGGQVLPGRRPGHGGRSFGGDLVTWTPVICGTPLG